MKLIYFFLLISTCLIGCKSGFDFDSDLLINNSFEEGSGNQSNNWWVLSGPYEVKRTDEVAFDGDYAFQISIDSAVSGDFAFVAQYIQDYQTGKNLILSVRIKTENVQGEGLSIAIRGDNDQNNSLAEYFFSTQWNTEISGTQDWTEYTLTTEDPLPLDISLLTIYLIMLPNTSGTAYFDAVVLDYEE